ncbi:uncharacterized protein LOC129609055 [Condylostylus longicornis]|uniref:uncharacterized protein LOC129609055 n=1 Tax=Condylostylus longicornis TaxID=2530218 RepID=UPI00244E3A53|nr:uncharacterized protein LOC129609055 [Condylostylus longicornis]
MSVVKYVGRKTDFRGKTLWEILGNLKNFGVGRIVVRSMFERYPEPCFYKVLKVEALPNEECRKVKVTVEKTFRGHTYPKPSIIMSASYKADYRLIPKDEEAQYCKIETKSPEGVVCREMDFPPLLKQFIEEETGIKNPKLPVHFKEGRDKRYRLAAEGETPTIKIEMGLGKPISPKLYEHL